jgi:hypothetical protein
MRIARRPLLTVTQQRGKLLAAYCYLAGKPGQRSHRTRRIARGLVADFDREPLAEVARPIVSRPAHGKACPLGHVRARGIRATRSPATRSHDGHRRRDDLVRGGTTGRLAPYRGYQSETEPGAPGSLAISDGDGRWILPMNGTRCRARNSSILGIVTTKFRASTG